MQHPVVENLYQVFEPYRVTKSFQTCDMEILTVTELQNLKGELRQLTPPDLDRFAWKALTTWGAITDFKHFLPRLFELALRWPTQFDSLEVLFGKLQYGRWDTWPDDEQRAIREYLPVFWASAIEHPVTDALNCSADIALCALGNTDVDLLPFLEFWRNSKCPSSRAQMSRFMECNQNVLKAPGTLANSFWVPNREKTVVAWIQENHPFDS